MYLLDTNVVSELRKARPHGGVIAWLGSVSTSQLYLCAFTLGELQAGAERTRRQDQKKATEIDAWIDEIPAVWEIISMNAPIFREWARLMAGKSDELFEDAMIAATARVRGFTVVTRNVKDFRHFHVEVLNPFSAAR
ncbi:MAG: type II toxin-antitoxin system VapC family toxin [Acidobacteriaceae bacterium]